MEKTCDLQLGYCKIYLSGNKSIELTINPIPIRAGKKLTFELIIKNIPVRIAQLHITPVPIKIKSKKIRKSTKGKTIDLKQTGNFAYTKRTRLPGKGKGGRDWFIIANIETPSGDGYAVLFTFESRRKSRSLLEAIKSSGP